jgi:hypothetical protein
MVLLYMLACNLFNEQVGKNTIMGTRVVVPLKRKNTVRRCKVCGIEQSIFNFPPTNKHYRLDGTAISWNKHTCYTCRNKKRVERGWK